MRSRFIAHHASAISAALTLVLAPPSKAQEGAGEFDVEHMYLKGYMLVQEAEKSEKQDDRAQAYFKYMEANDIFASVARDSPDWNATMVTYRRNLVRKKMDETRVDTDLYGPGDTEWLNTPNSEAPSANAQEVSRHLKLSRGYFELGEFEKSRDEIHRLLALDPYNAAARRLLERAVRRITLSLANGGDPSGRDLGGGVDGSQVILDKLRTLIIPSVALEQATIEDAVQFLRLKSRELDTTTHDPVRRGVNFILRVAPTGPMPKITSLNLTNVPLGVAVKAVADMTGFTQRVEPYAVIISPASCELELYTKVFRVPPNFLSLQGSAEAGGDGSTPAPALPGAAAIDVLKSAGITFPDQGAAFFSAATSTLTVRNTPASFELVSKFVEMVNNRSVDASHRPGAKELPGVAPPQFRGGARPANDQSLAHPNHPANRNQREPATTVPGDPAVVGGTPAASPRATGFDLLSAQPPPDLTTVPASRPAEGIMPECVALEFLPDQGGARLTWTSHPGQPLHLEASDDLATWAAVGLATESKPGVFEIVDPAAADSQSRFYRAVMP